MKFGEKSGLPLADLERVEVELSGVDCRRIRRVQAIALSEIRRELGERDVLQIPRQIREAALGRLRLLPLEIHGEPAPNPVDFAQAVLEVCPRQFPRGGGSSGRQLRKDAKVMEAQAISDPSEVKKLREAAEVQEFHEQLDAAVRQVQRYIDRSAEESERLVGEWTRALDAQGRLSALERHQAPPGVTWLSR